MADFQLLMGTNTVDGSSGVLTSNGNELIGLEISAAGELLVNVDVYDATGRHVAKLRRNAWSFNDASYKIRTQKADLILTDGKGDVVLEVNAGQPHQATIRRATLFTPKGTPFTVTPEELNMAGTTLRQCTFKGSGTAFDIGD